MPTRRSFLLSSAAATAALPLAAQSAPVLPAPIAALSNRSHEAVPITLAERQRRVDRARELMKQQKIAAIAITGGTSLVYFTGIRSGVSERMFAWILPASGAPYIVCPAFEEARMTEQLSQMPDGAHTRIYTWNEDEDPYALLVAHIPGPGPLALDERVPFVYADRLAKAAPSRTIVSGIPVTAGCRAIKSSAELAIMQLANNITLSCYKAAYESGHPGMTTAEFTALVSKGFAQCGVSGAISCQTGEWSALPHGSIKPQVIRENQIVLIDDGCVLEGYVSDISRTFVYGKASDRQKKIFDVVHAAQAAALSAAKVGAPCHVVDDAARKIVTDAGFGPDYKTFSHRLGHGIGMDGHEWPYLVRGNNQPLEVGMCFSDEPGIYLPGEFGVRLEDDWHMAAQGGVMFTPTSSSLEHPFD
ncbi:Xaa-Pro dipeptidase [Granulicella pectinivorans]|uniref:Xaa-Pro dipeptidase n=1 Tax=Granulicella pectinivorans TaxID=474950 RepID=A0A1I6MH31_9BACT|nr:Xaa-Pro peptidase family protein [Granulicella pectinivorans]SFS15004.1 Xaa-Pro dipeptidase [Granulicella pectinivorans]